MPKGRPEDYNVRGKPSSGVKPGSPSAKAMPPKGKMPPGKPAMPGKMFGTSMKGIGRMGKGMGASKGKK